MMLFNGLDLFWLISISQQRLLFQLLHFRLGCVSRTLRSGRIVLGFTHTLLRQNGVLPQAPKLRLLGSQRTLGHSGTVLNLLDLHLHLRDTPSLRCEFRYASASFHFLGVRAGFEHRRAVFSVTEATGGGGLSFGVDT